MQIQGIKSRNLAKVYYSKFCFKLEGMLIITAKAHIIMHRYVSYNRVTVYFLCIFTQAILVRSFNGKRKASTGLTERIRVIERIPASSSDSDSDSDEDEEVIFRQCEIGAACEDNSDKEEDEAMDQKSIQARRFMCLFWQMADIAIKTEWLLDQQGSAQMDSQGLYLKRESVHASYHMVLQYFFMWLLFRRQIGLVKQNKMNLKHTLIITIKPLK